MRRIERLVRAFTLIVQASWGNGEPSATRRLPLHPTARMESFGYLRPELLAQCRAGVLRFARGDDHASIRTVRSPRPWQRRGRQAPVLASGQRGTPAGRRAAKL